MIRVVGKLPPGPGIVVATPHVSHFDGPLLAACLPEPILWGVDPEFMETQPWKAGLWLTRFLTGSEIVPISGQRPFGMRALARRLREGGKVGLFPEGGDQSDGGAALASSSGGGKTGPVMPSADHSGPDHGDAGVDSFAGAGEEKKADPKGND